MSNAGGTLPNLSARGPTVGSAVRSAGEKGLLAGKSSARLPGSEWSFSGLLARIFPEIASQPASAPVNTSLAVSTGSQSDADTTLPEETAPSSDQNAADSMAAMSILAALMLGLEKIPTIDLPKTDTPAGDGLSLDTAQATAKVITQVDQNIQTSNTTAQAGALQLDAMLAQAGKDFTDVLSGASEMTSQAATAAVVDQSQAAGQLSTEAGNQQKQAVTGQTTRVESLSNLIEQIGEVHGESQPALTWIAAVQGQQAETVQSQSTPGGQISARSSTENGDQASAETAPVEKKISRAAPGNESGLEPVITNQPARSTEEVQEPTRLAQAPSIMLDQIAKSVQAGISQNHSALRVHLQPAELGGIEIRLVSGPNGVDIVVLAEKASTGQMLEAQAHQLQQTIVNAGVSLAHLTVGQDTGLQAQAQANSMAQQGQPHPEAKKQPGRTKKQVDLVDQPEKEVSSSLIDYRL